MFDGRRRDQIARIDAALERARAQERRDAVRVVVGLPGVVPYVARDAADVEATFPPESPTGVAADAWRAREAFDAWAREATVDERRAREVDRMAKAAAGAVPTGLDCSARLP